MFVYICFNYLVMVLCVFGSQFRCIQVGFKFDNFFDEYNLGVGYI